MSKEKDNPLSIEMDVIQKGKYERKKFHSTKFIDTTNESLIRSQRGSKIMKTQEVDDTDSISAIPRETSEIIENISKMIKKA